MTMKGSTNGRVLLCVFGELDNLKEEVKGFAFLYLTCLVTYPILFRTLVRLLSPK